MAIFLDDSNCKTDLYPFTETRHTADIRIGILTIREKWELILSEKINTSSDNTDPGSLYIPSNVIPTYSNYALLLLAAKERKVLTQSDEIKIFEHPWQLPALNAWAIQQDFNLITKNRTSRKSVTSNCIAQENIFIEEGATVEYCIINASDGPVYIGKDSHVMEGCMIRGPFAICNNSVLKMGTKVYGGTTIGPWCVAGGEIKNSILFGYSNKAHDGYLGDSVIGEWCNLGAGTSNSNVKNSASDININVHDKTYNAGLKAGLFMGDYSRAAINTSFNTGSIVGVCCNIFGREFPTKVTENFTWGSERYQLEKVFTDIENWKKLKNSVLTEAEKTRLEELYKKDN